MLRHSNQTIAPFPTTINREHFASWLSGFTDGEGSFCISCHKRHKNFTPSFKIKLRADDFAALELANSFWQCGAVVFHKADKGRPNPQASFLVRDWKNLATVIVPHFDKYPLIAKKHRDFAIWREAVLFGYPIAQRKRRGRGKGRGLAPGWTPAEWATLEKFREMLATQRHYNATTLPPTPSSRQASFQEMLPGF